MKWKFSIWLVCIFCALCEAQTVDTLQAAALLKKAQQLYDSAQFPESRQAAEQALRIFKNQSALNRQVECSILLGNIFADMGAPEKALAFYQVPANAEQLNPALKAQCLNNTAEIYFKKRDVEPARALHEQALKIRLDYFGENHPDVADSYNNLGNCALPNLARAIELHQKALKIRQAVLPPDHPDLAVSYINLANLSRQNQDPAQALDFYQKALPIREKKLGAAHPKTLALFSTIGELYFEKNEPVEALRYYRRALSVGNFPAAQAAVLYDKIGLCLQQVQDFEAARREHENAIRLTPPDDPNLGGMYNNLANCYFKNEEFYKAAEQYQKALDQTLRNASAESAQPVIYNNMGLCYLAKNDYRRASIYFKKTGELSAGNDKKSFGLNLARALRKRKEFVNADAVLAGTKVEWQKKGDKTDRLLLINLLGTEAEFLLESGAHENVRQAANLLDRAMSLADSIQSGLGDNTAPTTLNDLFYRISELAIRANFFLFEKENQNAFLEKIFLVSEKNKSWQLLRAVRQANAEKFARVPDSLLKKEQQLAQQLLLFEKNQARSGQPESGYLETRLAQQQLIRDIEKNYPEYFRLKYSLATTPLAAVQKSLLKSGQALLEYFIGSEHIFIIVVQKEKTGVLEIKKDFPLERLVMQLRESVEAYPRSSGATLEKAIRDYNETAYLLYQKLIAPVLQKTDLPPALVIVPDGILHFLPFEILLSSPPKDPHRFKNHPYLLRDYACSYVASATLLEELQKQPGHKNSAQMLALAPDFKNNLYGLAELRRNKTEAQSAIDLFGGRLLSGPAARLDTFLKIAGNYNLLLLATHGQANPRTGDYSWIAFSEISDTLDNELLYARDLYAQNWKADLAVLSACESGVGEWRRSEGLLGMARGFFFAGTRCLLATLWSVDDARNSELITSFFEILKKGETPESALQKAQLAYLESHTNDEAHPVYWAAPVVTGYPAALQPDSRALSWWWLLLIIPLCFLLFYFRKKGV